MRYVILTHEDKDFSDVDVVTINHSNGITRFVKMDAETTVIGGHGALAGLVLLVASWGIGLLCGIVMMWKG